MKPVDDPIRFIDDHQRHVPIESQWRSIPAPLNEGFPVPALSQVLRLSSCKRPLRQCDDGCSSNVAPVTVKNQPLHQRDAVQQQVVPNDATTKTVLRPVLSSSQVGHSSHNMMDAGTALCPIEILSDGSVSSSGSIGHGSGGCHNKEDENLLLWNVTKPHDIDSASCHNVGLEDQSTAPLSPGRLPLAVSQHQSTSGTAADIDLPWWWPPSPLARSVRFHPATKK